MNKSLTINIQKKSYNANKTLELCSYRSNKRISKTSQGSVYKGINLKTKEEIIIKRVDIKLLKAKCGVLDGKVVKIQENVMKEASVMMLLQKKAPEMFLKLYDFVGDEKNYFLIEENGGECLFSHVTKCHEMVQEGTLKLSEWLNHAKVLFKRMAQITELLHGLRCCHFDISLENMLIKDCLIDSETKAFKKHGKLFFCDFGLADIFDKNNNNNNFKSKKFVGKKNYQSPKVFIRKEFDARKNDIYCLGVCLFCMVVGYHPYQWPHPSCPMFQNLWAGHTKEICESNGRAKYISPSFVDLISKIITTENCRYSASQILSHPYLN